LFYIHVISRFEEEGFRYTTNKITMTEQLKEVYSLLDECKKIGGADFLISNICFKETNDKGIGVYANERIEREGAILISVPFRLCVSVDMIINVESLKRVFEDTPGYLSYPDEVLSIGLIFALLRLNSPNHALHCPHLQHVRALPKIFNTSLFWSEDELNELKGCNVFHITQLLKKQLAADFDSLYKPLIDSYPDLFSGLTIDHYFWALSVVYSRSAEIIRFGQTVRCIAPLLDMANHNPLLLPSQSDALYYDPDSDSLQLKNVSAELQAEDECYAFYGNYSNSKLLHTYGFVVHDNPYRAIDLWTKVTPNIYRSQYKQQILQSHPLTAVQTYDFSGTIRDGYISAALLATVRVIQANEVELEDIEKVFMGQMVSVRNEKASYVSLKNLMIARMNPDKAEVSLMHVLCM
jgi:hypothetical protein